MDPIFLEAPYRSSRNYDEACALAQETFPNGPISERKLQKKYGRCHPDEISRWGTANNAALYAQLRGNRDPSEAKALVEHLDKDETLIWLMNKIISPLDLKWSTICIQEQTIIGPSRVEEIIRENFDINDKSDVPYLGARAAAFVTPGQMYEWCSVQDASHSTRFQDDLRGVDIGEGHFEALLDGEAAMPKEMIRNFIRSEFALRGIKNWACVEMPKKAVPFFNLRFVLSSVGKRVHEDSPLRDYRHKWRKYKFGG
ncbi:MAG: hypothetical protein QF486_00615 [Candidatus Woesearchaeota archaeon]|jgi:hypothetical protein|nr:hypothetical protein [Candidatus Woesearchaeota archaeon]MDP7181277.1 hypothetical protein [Candidatus Woesearchaeota archaeon]MDP7198104.1 hypothetical protein [Candidatus Woesearchaeota archaeon]MDP7466938.1 hypothetical protein [Candidatus Woesearchaeota archaeon]MDP7647374.1 hypothetical protein [Candidatus Woesearchaeota archaeon]